MADSGDSKAKHVPLTAAPAAGQLVEHEGKTYTTIKEGLAYILIPPEAPLQTDPAKVRDGTQQAQSVFYNPIQEYNRDLSVLAIRVFGEDYVATNEAKARKKAEMKRKRKEVKRKREEEKRGPDSAQNLAANGSEQGPRGQKRKSPTEEVNQAEGHAHSPKKQKLEELSFPGLDDRPIFSSNVKPGDEPTDEFDDSFGDGGLADEDFLAAEQKVREAGLIQGTDAHQNGVHDEKADAGGAPKTEPTPNETSVQFRILDALSASGLRALRYAKEIPFVTTIIANDLSSDAVGSITNNVKHNGLHESKVIKTRTGDAISHMAQVMTKGHPGNYTVIDLDPYGTAIPFLDTAVQSVVDGGLLCVTCTDASVFNSLGYLEKTYSQYGGIPFKGDSFAEAGLRLILNSIATAAGKYGIAMEPLLSLSIDYYARVFVRLRKSAAEVKLQGSKTMVVYNCDGGCGAWTTQHYVRSLPQVNKKTGQISYKHTPGQAPNAAPLCQFCGYKTHLAGPMYGGPLHNPDFIQRILDLLPTLDKDNYQTIDRMRGMLTTALEETDIYEYPQISAPKVNPVNLTTDPNDEKTSGDSNIKVYTKFERLPESMIDHSPFYIVPSSLSKVLHCPAPSVAQFQGALRHQGYRCGRSHAKGGSIKTDAPWSALWEIMREWVRQKCPAYKYESLSKTSAGWKILNNSAPIEEKLEGEWQEVLKDTGELKVLQVDGEWKVMRKITVAPENGEKPEKGPEPTKELQKVIFDETLGNKGRGAAKGLVRYQQNPRENWGPMARAKTTKAKVDATRS